MTEKRVRLFIAVTLPQPLLAYLSNLSVQLGRQLPPRSVRWVTPERMHLTLRFLGSTAVSQIDPLQNALRSAVILQPSCQVRLSELGAFPNKKRPRVIWVGLTGDANKLHDLRQSIDTALGPLGWPIKNKPFSAHITLGRVKNKDGWSETFWRRSIEPVEWEITAVHLIKSELRPTGPIYQTLHAVPLRLPGSQ